jgi:hypothetical protein
MQQQACLQQQWPGRAWSGSSYNDDAILTSDPGRNASVGKPQLHLKACIISSISYNNSSSHPRIATFTGGSGPEPDAGVVLSSVRQAVLSTHISEAPVLQRTKITP